MKLPGPPAAGSRAHHRRGHQAERVNSASSTSVSPSRSWRCRSVSRSAFFCAMLLQGDLPVPEPGNGVGAVHRGAERQVLPEPDLSRWRPAAVRSSIRSRSSHVAARQRPGGRGRRRSAPARAPPPPGPARWRRRRPRPPGRTGPPGRRTPWLAAPSDPSAGARRAMMAARFRNAPARITLASSPGRRGAPPRPGTPASRWWWS
jgi:hypothetical protein